MKVIVIDTVNDRITCAVEDRNVLHMVALLETSNNVKSFYIDGMNVRDQQAQYQTVGYTKWVSPIQQ